MSQSSAGHFWHEGSKGGTDAGGFGQRKFLALTSGAAKTAAAGSTKTEPHERRNCFPCSWGTKPGLRASKLMKDGN